MALDDVLARVAEPGDRFCKRLEIDGSVAELDLRKVLEAMRRREVLAARFQDVRLGAFAGHVADVLRDSPSLTELTLRHSHLGDGGVAVIADALAYNRVLRSLRFEGSLAGGAPRDLEEVAALRVEPSVVRGASSALHFVRFQRAQSRIADRFPVQSTTNLTKLRVLAVLGRSIVLSA